MPRLTNTAPPRLLNSEMIILPHEGHPRPLVAVLTLDTDDGTMELAVNVALGDQLFRLLDEFLEKADPTP